MPAAQICVAANSSCSVTAIQVANNLRSSTQIDKEYAGLYSSLRSFTKTDGADRLRLIAYAPAVVVIIIVLVLELGAGGFGSSAGSWLPLAEVSAVMGSVLGGTLWFGWANLASQHRR